MVVKYKLGEVAKDFNKSSKDIADLLLKFFEEPKKNQTALEGKELDIIFDVLTQENQVESFNDYFAMQKPVKKDEKKPAEKKETAKKAEEKKADKKPVAEVKKEDKKEENKKASEKKAETKAPAKQNQNKENKPNDKKAKQEAPKAPEKKQNQEPNLNPFKKKEKKKDDGPMQSRTKGERVSIDTRANNVELEKYNEKYENEPFVRVLKKGAVANLKNVKYTNMCDISLHFDKRTNTLIVVSTIDNMVKGAAGQAIQNMNLIFGLPETTGLDLVPPAF